MSLEKISFPRWPRPIRTLAIKVYGYLYIARITNTLVCFCLIYKVAGLNHTDGPHRVIPALIISFLAAGGFVFNDICDLDKDRITCPWRVLPSEILRKEEAISYAILLFSMALGLSVMVLSLIKNLLVLLIAALLLTYSYLSKLMPGYKNLCIAAVSASIIYIGAAEAKEWQPFKIFIMAEIFLFVLQREIAMDIAHVEGDAAAGLKTLPMLVGTRKCTLIRIIINVLIAVFAYFWLAAASGNKAFVETMIVIAGLSLISILLHSIYPHPKLERVYIECGKIYMIAATAVL